MGHYPKSEQIKKGEKAYEKNILYGTQRGTSGREHACLCGGGITVHENTAYLYGSAQRNLPRMAQHSPWMCRFISRMAM